MKIIIGIIIALLCVNLASAACHQNSNGGWINDAGTTCWEMYQGGAATTSSTPAGTLDKKIASIHNCNNVSININKVSGNNTPISFKGCTGSGSNLNCDCRDVDGLFNVTLQTDRTPLNSEYRLYDVDMTYTSCQMSKSKISLTVRDWGDSAQTYGEQTTDLGSDIMVVDRIQYANRTIEINKTVYVDRIINLSAKEIPKYIYIENKSKIDAAEAQTIAVISGAKFWTRLWFSLWVLFTLVFIGHEFYMSKKYYRVPY